MISSIHERYTEIYEKLKEISTRYENAEGQLTAAHEQDEVAKQKRIENLREQLKKIEEYGEKVDYFRHMAERHLQSKNLLTITPRELNFNRLRNWAMMIDPTETDDPYAQRIYVQAKCNELFLQQKKEAFEASLHSLLEDDGQPDAALRDAVAELQRRLVEECRAVVESEAFDQLAGELTALHKHYVDEQQLQSIREQETEGETVGVGVYAQALPVLEPLRYAAKAKLGEYYDSKTSSILLPVAHSTAHEVIFSVGCTAAKEKKLFRGIQHYLLNTISKTAIGSRRITIIDGLHFNHSVLGALRPMEGSTVIDPIPRDAEQAVDALRQIVSSFADIDEALGLADTVAEFNASAEPKDRLQRRLLVLVGYPSAFSGEARNYIKRILLNHAHYGISVILADSQGMAGTEDKNELPVEIADNFYRIYMGPRKETIAPGGGSAQHFRWYELRSNLSEVYLETIRGLETRVAHLGNEYIKRVDLENIPPYERGKKSIVLPYGVDSKDEMHSISFDNENFASFLMGASGSGKSTLIHTLITGILRDYHPDDVELWLADFKMSEFAQYMDPLPPHVKYILLDESPELVYDLVDRLTEKMMERQRFFMHNRELKKVENVPKDIYMPVIFVILDEFSIMSQALYDSEIYKLRLQNLLAKGRALGIKFIFASQTFTKGVAGLTNTAKDQIQSRIAMKNSYTEINDTLELTPGVKTEQVKTWMEALPPYFTLTKTREGEGLVVKRLKGMYFKGAGNEAMAPQRRLIERLNSRMRKIEQADYDPGQLDTYVDKHPVIVDGNSYRSFKAGRILQMIDDFRADQRDEVSPEDMVFTFGTPRKMVNAKFAVVTNESRENLLMLARSTEQACAMSLIETAMRTFELQGGDVQVWAYHKNRLYRTYKDSHFALHSVAEGMDEICDAIRALKDKIRRKESGNRLIVLLGMEQICSDFELIDFDSEAEQHSSVTATAANIQKLQPKTEEELQDAKAVLDLQKGFQEAYDIDAKIDQWIDDGWSDEEIEAEEDRLFAKFKAENGIADAPVEAAAQAEEDPFTQGLRLQQKFRTECNIEELEDRWMEEGWSAEQIMAEEDRLFAEFVEAEDDMPTIAIPEIEAEADEKTVEPEATAETAEDEKGAYNALEDFKYIVRQGSRFGYHFMLCLSNLSDLHSTKLQKDLFRHKLAFQISGEDASNLFANRAASKLPEHICQYSDNLETYSLRPFIHEGIVWDGWDVDADGEAVNSII